MPLCDSVQSIMRVDPAAGRIEQCLDGGHPRIALLPPVARRSKATDVMLAEGLIEDIAMGLAVMRGIVVVAPHTARCLRGDVDWVGRLERNDNATNLVAEHLAPLSLRVRTTSRDFR